MTVISTRTRIEAGIDVLTAFGTLISFFLLILFRNLETRIFDVPGTVAIVVFIVARIAAQWSRARRLEMGIFAAASVLVSMRVAERLRMLYIVSYLALVLMFVWSIQRSIGKQVG